MVLNVHQYNVIIEALNEIAKDKYTIKVNQVCMKIMPMDVNSYRNIVHMLKEQQQKCDAPLFS